MEMAEFSLEGQEEESVSKPQEYVFNLLCIVRLSLQFNDQMCNTLNCDETI